MSDTPIMDRVNEIIAEAKASSDPPVAYLAARIESLEWELRTLNGQVERLKQQLAPYPTKGIA